MKHFQLKHFSGNEKMKTLVSLMCILAALCFTGCLVVRHERERRVVVPPPPPVVVYETVPYDDPGRGWYIEGYYAPGGVYVAPFWTFDIAIVHRHFDHYRGHHRGHFDKHFREHRDRYDDRRHDSRGRDDRGRGRH